MTKKQNYEGKEIAVRFDPALCIHAGECVHGLPKVFRPDRQGGWIFPDEAEAEALAALIERCPSGALTYELADGSQEQPPARNSITVEKDGPLHLHAEFSLNGEKPDSWRATLCRCGASQNKPFCDGSHGMAGFRASGEVAPFKADTQLPPGTLKLSTLKDGPLYFEGPLYICNAEGEVARAEEKIAFCRCGASQSKPFCDGSHAAIGFKTD